MISKKLAKMINEQINWEFYSEHYYLAMAAYLAELNLDGFSNFFIVQAQEEHFHAMKFYSYLLDRGSAVELQAIDNPSKREFSSPVDVFEAALEHEKFVTSNINNLMDAAIKDNDHASSSFLKWYIDEQVEEEASMEKYVNKLKLIGGTGAVLLMLDNEFATRVFNPPVV